MFDAQSDFICVAHRVASGHKPGNTIAAIKKALELGAKAIEIDIHKIGDELLVTHDTLICDPLQGTIDITKCSMERTRAIDVGKGLTIPTLEEVLNVVNASVYVNLELKGKGTARPVCDLISRYIEEKDWPEDHFALSSFDIRELEIARSVRPDITLGLLIDRKDIDFVQLTARVRARSIGASLGITGPELIRAAHANDLKVFVFTVNGIANIKQLKSMGADGVFTDFPEQCI
ncbi:MAG: glycerophosphodiester phosphodiesterase [Nitrospirae bacterium]|nr:glycerophosphodiester phosphodiesterase [Nitrospirota bacterium]